MAEEKEKLEGSESGPLPHPDTAGDAAPPAAPPDAPDEVIARCLRDDAEQTADEQDQAARLLAELEEWAGRQRELAAALARLREHYRQAFADHAAREQALPPEALERLADRRESLQMCGRMLERLADRVAAGPPPEAPPEVALLPLDGALLREQFAGLAAAEAEPAARDLLRQRRITHQQALSDLRDRRDAAEKRLTQTVVRHFLPVLDGLDEGRRIAAPLHEELAARFTERAAELDGWFAIYDHLIAAALNELKKLHVEPLAVERGDSVDYEAHEPLDVEADAGLADEQIKEVVRRGYVATDAAAAGRRILRPAQVVVVRNPSEE